MFLEAAVLPLVVEFRVVGESELYGSADDDVGVEVTVCFGHNLPVDAAWRPGSGGTVVFDSFAHHLQLFGREPLAQPGVGGEDLTAREVMDGPGA